MNAKDAVFITGGSGFLGSQIALKALKEGVGVRLLVRGKDRFQAYERIRRVFSYFGVTQSDWDDFRERIEVFSGDVTIPGFGLSKRELDQMTDNLPLIFHCAAHTDFNSAGAAIAASVNIDGTRNILKLTETCGARLIHISTAYIVGDVRGKVFEKMQTGTFPWKNVYEKTKFIAEREVHFFSDEKNLDYLVFRPAVLIGDFVHGRTLRFNNIYNFIKIAYFLSLRRKGVRVCVDADPEARLNILPVDFAVDAMWRISQVSHVKQNIFHMANPSPPRFRELAEIYSKILDIHAVCIDPSKDKGKNNANPGKGIGAGFDEYNRYMIGEPEFDLSNTRSIINDYAAAFPRMDETYYRKILNFAIGQKWGKVSKTNPRAILKRDSKNFTDRYFNHFLKSKLHQRLVQNLKNLDAVIGINIRDETIRDEKNSGWVLELKKGMLTAVSKNGRKPECVYETDVDTFKVVVQGDCPPQKAFFDGRGDISGDLEKGLKVITALSEFFKRYPFDPENCK